MTTPRLNIRIGTDGREAVDGIKPVESALDRVHGAAGRAERGLDGVGESLARAGRYAAGLAGISIGAHLVQEAIAAADASTNLASRLRLVTTSQVELASAQQRVFDIAQATRAELSSTGDLYAKITKSSEALGLSQGRTAALTETVAKTMAISGASAAASSAVILQFGQALGSGVLRGDEFNSVMEQSPALIEAIAKGMGKTTGEMRALAEQGALTSTAILAALEKQAPAVARQFEQLAPTVAGAWQQVSNATVAYIGRVDQASGSTAGLAGALSVLASNINGIANTALLAGSVALGVVTARGLSAAASVATLAAAQIAAKPPVDALSAALGVQAARLTASQLAARAASGAVGLLGGPIGVVTTVLTVGATAWTLWGNRAEDAASRAATAMREAQDEALKTGRSELEVARERRDVAAEKYFGGAMKVGAPEQQEFARWEDEVKRLETREANLAKRLNETQTSGTWGELYQSKAGQHADQVKKLDAAYAAETARFAGNQEKQLQLAKEYQQKLATLRASQTGKVAGDRTLFDYRTQDDVNSILLLIEYNEQLAEAEAAATKAVEDAAAARRNYMADEVKAATSTADGHRKTTEALRDELVTIGKSPAEIAAYQAAKLDAAAASEEFTARELDSAAALLDAQAALPEVAAGYRDLAAAKRASATALRERAGLQDAVETAKASAQAWKEFSRDIEQSLTDALYRSFEAGGNFGDTFARNLERTFKALALKAAIQYVVSYAGGAASSFANAATGGAVGQAGGMAGQAGSTLISEGGKWVYSKASPYIDSATSYLGFGASSVGGITNAGTAAGLSASGSGLGLTSTAGGSYGLQASAGASTAGTGAGAAGASSTSWIPIIGWIIAGMMASNSLSKQGYGHEGEQYENIKSKNPLLQFSSGNVMGGLAQALGVSKRVSDILFAAPIDNNLSNAILGGKQTVIGSGIEVRAKDNAFHGGYIQEVVTDGGMFSSDSSEVQRSSFSAGDRAMIQSMLDAVVGRFVNPANAALGANIAFSMNYGGSGAGLMTAVEAALVKSIEASDVSHLFRGIKTSIEMAKALESFTNIQDSLTRLGQRATLRQAGELAVGAGSESLTAGMTAYYNAFFSETEKAKNYQTDINALLTGLLGETIPKTRAEFRTLAESLDLSGEAGRRTFAGLMELAPGFDQMLTNLDGAAGGVSRFNASLIALRASLYAGENSGLSASARYATSKASLAGIASAAAGGDTAAVESLGDAVKEFLNASRGVARTSFDYARDRAVADAALTGAIASTAPRFAVGGVHAGGVRIVGENGPELEITGPSRIVSNSATRSLLDNSGVIAEIRALRSEVAALRTLNKSAADSNKKIETILRTCTQDGDSLRTIPA